MLQEFVISYSLVFFVGDLQYIIFFNSRKTYPSEDYDWVILESIGSRILLDNQKVNLHVNIVHKTARKISNFLV